MKKNTIKSVPTLRELEITLKKLDKQIKMQRKFTKQGEANIILDMLLNEKEGLVTLLNHRTNPKNAVRCSLPKKQQRKLGLLPQIA